MDTPARRNTLRCLVVSQNRGSVGIFSVSIQIEKYSTRNAQFDK
ncbi:hypothetical protein GCHA_1953 [Paraglaciecola chathamensis S18K6]|uniref:Uncharacterized protein n=1 Tax=Paraglaciecola chathamensis S18K6 TaxID=1127672 RepID=A0AAV3UYQ8_9ALTE|nr:hypothetical protein GCHA_1953 [Paraglaciecola chathamensis S18K6]